MNTMHLIGSDDVSRAGANISRAADTINSAAGTIDEAARRMAGQLETHGYQMEALMEALASQPTLHDQFAMAAMQAILSSEGAMAATRGDQKLIAKTAFALATAMMKEREA